MKCWPLLLLVGGLLGAIGFLGWSLDVAIGQPRPQQPPVFAAPLQGKVVTKQTAQLVRFPQPIAVHPSIHPPVQAGRSWHWHQSYGWVSLPVGTVQQTLLPATYQLPAQVVTYEATGPAPLQMTCPHCGQPIILTVR